MRKAETASLDNYPVSTPAWLCVVVQLWLYCLLSIHICKIYCRRFASEWIVRLHCAGELWASRKLKKLQPAPHCSYPRSTSHMVSPRSLSISGQRKESCLCSHKGEIGLHSEGWPGWGPHSQTLFAFVLFWMGHAKTQNKVKQLSTAILVTGESVPSVTFVLFLCGGKGWCKLSHCLMGTPRGYA